jgi:hypothetical protein
MLDAIESVCLSSILKKEYKMIINKQEIYVNNLFQKYQNVLNLNIVHTENFGLNFAFIGVSGAYYFPSALWYAQSYKKSKSNLIDLSNASQLSFLDLQYQILKFVTNNEGTRKGYSIELLESLNFYIKYYFEQNSNSEKKFDPEFKLIDYTPEYVSEFTKEIFKNNFQSVSETIGSYLLPNNSFWNIGSILLDPFFNYEDNDEFYTLFPYWLIKKDKKVLFSLLRMSPLSFVNKFKLKMQIVNSIHFFINFNHYSKSKENLYLYNFPDLFKSYEVFENQNYILMDKNKKGANYLRKSNWEITINSSKKAKIPQEQLDTNENDAINNFISENLQVIAYVFNNYKDPEKNKIHQIMFNFERKNIFKNLFMKRLRLDRNNLNIDLIIWLKSEKNKLNNHKLNIIDFFSAIFPTGIVISYYSGVMFYLSIHQRKKGEIIHNLVDFLEFSNFEYKIYENFDDHGFLVYSLPPSELFYENNWHFQKSKLKIEEQTFKRISYIILEKERQFENLELNRSKINDFELFLKKL